MSERRLTGCDDQGFVTGLLASVLFYPTVSYTKWDQRKKAALICLSLPALATLTVVGLFMLFWEVDSDWCTWCADINCLPVEGWCDGALRSKLLGNQTLAV